MKKTFSYFLMAMMTMVLSFAIQPDAQAQAGSIKIDRGMDADSLYIMATDTVYSKYRYGKSKWLNFEQWRPTMLAGVADSLTIAGYDDIVIGTEGGELKMFGAPIRLLIEAVPTYADDTAAGAGGLTAGALYKTSAGVLMIKL